MAGELLETFISLNLQQDEDYDLAKRSLFYTSGVTASSAGEAIFNVSRKDVMNWRPREMYCHCKRLVQRIFDGAKTAQQSQAAKTNALVRHYVGRDAKKYIDTNAAQTESEMIGTLNSFFEITGSLLDEEPRFNRPQQFTQRHSQITCYTCKEVGHKAAHCSKTQSTASVGDNKSDSGRLRLVTCFLCRQKGHYSSNCPNKSKTEVKTEEPAGPAPRKKKKVSRRAAVTPGKTAKVSEPTTSRWRENNEPDDEMVAESQEELIPPQTTMTMVGKVKQYSLPFRLDTGADISIVPQSIVPANCRSGRDIAIRDANGGLCLRPETDIIIEIANLQLAQTVALAPDVSLDGTAILKLDVAQDIDQRVLDYYVAQVVLVKKRQKAVQAGTGNGVEGEQSFKVVAKHPDSVDCRGANKDEGGRAQEELAGNELDNSSRSDERQDSLAGDDIEVNVQREDGGAVLGLDLQGLSPGGDRAELVKVTREDESLDAWRLLADKGEKGFSWEEGLLIKTEMGNLGECISLIVLPKPFRQRVLVLAHDKGGHLGRKKLGPIIKRSFVWPGLTGDVAQHCAQCELCQKMSRQGPRKAPMVERQLLSIPFEAVAVDFVGPFPKGRGGHCYLFTYICLASRWPDAVPMRSMTAKAVLRVW